MKPPLTPLASKAAALREQTAATAPIFREIEELYSEVSEHMRNALSSALRIGMRLYYLHRAVGDDTPGGFKAALDRFSDRIPRSTAYRWINAASNVIAGVQDLMDETGRYDPAEIKLPDPGTPAWDKLETALTESTKGMSLRRILIGSSATSEESRLNTLITASESGDRIADEILERVAKGELTLVQAIRALGGASTTREKERHDPVYLDIDGSSGRLTGLFPKCIITLSNTFARWDDLDESARREAKKAWKAFAVTIPKDLR